ncbi:MAG: diaminopimelate epimerase [Balneolaceae bacterium]|nr:diaminopimelate epimerase [Balneolaceae bacterium]MBO6547389.1 diaminopimelate epimerase [Balneolaceae bacterium]MBO6647664.1 diaminopimelate epimerase [Balneolaceae bacterium]
MSTLKFYKMEGAGNDFVVIDNRDAGLSMEEIISLTPLICDRKFGVGADGVLILESAQIEDVDYTMIYRNADGSEAGMCGNGGRCLALYATHHGFQNNHKFNVHNAIYEATVDKIEHQVSISFPDVLAPKKLQINKKKYLQVYTGTEHIVSFEALDRLEDEEDLIAEGSFIRNHALLNPPGTNVNFACIDEDTIYLQTYERGVEGLTLACGTGALASAIATHFKEEPSGTDFEYPITVKGGTLSVSFQFDESKNMYTHLTLSGPAHFVFTGTIDL